MPDVFEFTIPNPVVKLDESRTGTAVVDITSRLDRNAVVGVDVQPSEGAEPTWFGQPDPMEFTLPVGETLQVSVPVQIPPTAPPGEYQFAIRAFAIENQQEEFASSPAFSVTVAEAPQKTTIPNWLIALLAALLLLILILIVYFAFIRDTGPGEGEAVNLIGIQRAEAEEAVGEEMELQWFTDGSSEADSCALLQTPTEGTPTERIAVFAVPCPVPSPAPVVSASIDNVCGKSFTFCQRVSEDFGDDFGQNEEWTEAATGMVSDFISKFVVDGDPIPLLVGQPANEAGPTVEDAGFIPLFLSDGTGGSPCVLYQFGFPDSAGIDGEVVVAITTQCPANATLPDDVVLSTPVAYRTPAGLCAAQPPFCQLIDERLGDSYRTSNEFAAKLVEMETIFRGEFSGPVVPNVRDFELATALTTLEEKGLEGRYVTDDAAYRCWLIANQTPAPNTRISTLSDNIVTLSLKPSPIDPFNPKICYLVLNDDLTIDTNQVSEVIIGEFQFDPDGN